MIRRYLEAGYPCLYVTTFETHRATEAYVDELRKMIKDEEDEPEEVRSKEFEAYRWDLDAGIVDCMTNNPVQEPIQASGRTLQPNDPLYPIKFLTQKSENVILFLPNYDVFLKGSRPDLAHAIINDYMQWKDSGKTIVVLAPMYNVSTEMDRLFQLVDFPLPDEDYIKKIMADVLPDELVNAEYDPSDPDDEEYLIEFREDAIRAAKGMTSLEIENALCLSLIEKDEYDPLVIARIKQQQIKKSATLEISRATHKFKDIVGLTKIRPYLLRVAMHPLAQGILIVGPPGNGKTYLGEGLGNELGIITIIVSFERIMAAGGGIVGQAQAQAIQTFKTIDALAPAVVVLDEIEKGLAGMESSGRSDAGTKAGVGSEFLKWIEKKTPGIYVVATSNEIDSLPAAFKRAGRWDAIIGVDLPTTEEIISNLEYYGEKYLEDDAYDELINSLEEDDGKLLDALDGYSHAELMTITKQMSMLQCDVMTAMQWIKPIGKIDPDGVSRIRTWIKANAIMASDVRPIPALRKKAKEVMGERKIKRRIRKKKKKPKPKVA